MRQRQEHTHEKLRLTQAEFEALPEYSRTLPTGQTPGKRWKAQMRGGRWFIGEYDPKGPMNGQIAILWYRPVILCARPAPEPESSLMGKVSPGFDEALRRAKKLPRHAQGRNTAGR